MESSQNAHISLSPPVRNEARGKGRVDVDFLQSNNVSRTIMAKGSHRIDGGDRHAFGINGQKLEEGLLCRKGSTKEHVLLGRTRAHTQPADHLLEGSQTTSTGHSWSPLLWAWAVGMLQHDFARGDAGTTGAAFPDMLHHDALDSSVLALADAGPNERVNARNLLPDGLHRKALERTNARRRSMGPTALGPKVGRVSLSLPSISSDLMLVHRRPMLPAKPSEDSLRNQGTRVLRDANFANGTAPKRKTLGNRQQDRAMKLSGKVLAMMVNTIVIVTKASKSGNIRSLLPKRAELTCKHKIIRTGRAGRYGHLAITRAGRCSWSRLSETLPAAADTDLAG